MSYDNKNTWWCESSNQHKSALSEDTLRQKFALAHITHCGSLSMEQFKTMMLTEFGIEFSARELEASFSHLDTIQEI